MNAEQAKKLAREALDELTETLARGDSDRLRAYLAAMAHFHHYSFSNVLLILTQRPDATHVAGFRTWKKLGRYVKKGEHGIAIVAPMLIRPKDDDCDDAEAALRFKAVHVFDVSQTDGDELPEFAHIKGDPAGQTDRLKQFAETRGIDIEYVDELGGAHGVSTGGSISLCNDLDPAHEFSVLAHELAHELLHHVQGEDRPPKVVRETEAEAVAHVVTSAAGLDTNGAAADYIRLYRGDADTLATSLDRIQRTATEILRALSEQVD